MKTTGRWLITILAAAAAAQAATPDWSEVDRLVDRAGREIRPGLEVLAVRDGEVIYSRAAGGWQRNRRAAIASSTKWLAGAVVMAMVDAGKLSLDDTVGKFFPNAPADKRPITVRQLMSHTSGMGGDSDCIGSNTMTLAACAEEILAVPLQYKPGEVFAYAGDSMQVAGRIVEIAAGKDWNTVFRETIAGPVGMTATDFGLNNQTTNPRIAGGAISTANDYLRFLSMLASKGIIDGRRVLSEEAIAAMLADQTGGARIVRTPFSQYDDLNPLAPMNRYGVGNWVEMADAEGTPDVNSSGGAFGCVPWLDTRRGYAGILMTQNLLRESAEHYYPIRAAMEKVLDGPATLTRRSFLFQRRLRTYEEFVPPGEPPAAGWPILVALHARGGSGRQFATLTRLHETAGKEGALVVYPNGTPIAPGEANFEWNPDALLGPDDASFLGELLDRIGWERPVDFSRVWLTGYANGAAMAFRVACEIPWRLASVAPVSGTWRFGPNGYDGPSRVECNPQWTVPVLEVRGSTEPFSAAIPFWVRRQECPANAEPERLMVNGESVERRRFAPCLRGAEVWSMEVQESGPKWGDTSGELAWDFLKRFRRGEGFVTVPNQP